MRPDELDGAFAPLARTTVATVELDGEAVLYDETTLAVHRLSPVGTLVWHCFDGTTTIDQLAADLADAFRAEPAAVHHDVVELTRKLGGLGLLDGIEPVDPADG